jgi:hypothetical protein
MPITVSERSAGRRRDGYRAAREYFIFAACDTGCRDLDTRLLNPDFSTLAEDLGASDTPRVQVRPGASGPHLLAVRMSSCDNICYFGLVVLSRPARR